MRASLLAVLVATLLTAAAAPAHAAPARNGLIAYSVDDFVDDGPCFECQEEEPDPPPTRSWVELVRPDGRGHRRFPCTTGAFATCSDNGPVFAPGGRRLAVLNDDGIVIARPNGEILRRIRAPAFVVAWSPDGRELAYTGPYENPARPRVSRHAMYVMKLGNPAKRVPVAVDIDPFSLSWSARGQLAWHQRAPRKGIYVSNARGGERRRITRTDSLASFVHWAPDGRRLAFGCDWYFCVVAADGGERGRPYNRCRTEDIDVGGLAWSPDGSEVACLDRSGFLIALRTGTRERRVIRRDLGPAGFSASELSWQRR